MPASLGPAGCRGAQGVDSRPRLACTHIPHLSLMATPAIMVCKAAAPVRTREALHCWKRERILVAALQDVWFNRGAVSERWIAPEHRVKHRVVVPPQFAPAPPPYHCDGEAGAAVVPPSRPSTAAPTPARRSAFWERESGQAAKSALCYDDVYARAEQAAAAGSGQRRPGQQQAQGMQQEAHSAAPTARRAAQVQQAPQQRYPWSWDT